MFRAILVLALSAISAFAQHANVRKATSPAVACKLKPLPGTKLLRMVKPRYPTDADAKAIAQGVVVNVTIDKHGLPNSLRVIKGDPTVTRSVLAAIRQWRWKPFKLNGQAVEVDTNIYIRFEAPSN